MSPDQPGQGPSALDAVKLHIVGLDPDDVGDGLDDSGARVWLGLPVPPGRPGAQRTINPEVLDAS